MHCEHVESQDANLLSQKTLEENEPQPDDSENSMLEDVNEFILSEEGQSSSTTIDKSSLDVNARLLETSSMEANETTLINTEPNMDITEGQKSADLKEKTLVSKEAQTKSELEESGQVDVEPKKSVDFEKSKNTVSTDRYTPEYVTEEDFEELKRLAGHNSEDSDHLSANENPNLSSAEINEGPHSSLNSENHQPIDDDEPETKKAKYESEEDCFQCLVCEVLEDIGEPNEVVKEMEEEVVATAEQNVVEEEIESESDDESHDDSDDESHDESDIETESEDEDEIGEGAAPAA